MGSVVSVTKNRTDKNTNYNYPSKRAKYDTDSLRAALQRYNREPFIDLLTEWLQHAPSPDKIQEFADKNPDKYMMALSHIAKLSGFTEKQESEVNVNVRVHELSDSQLEDQLANLHNQLLSLEKKEDGSYAPSETQEPEETS